MSPPVAEPDARWLDTVRARLVFGVAADCSPALVEAWGAVLRAGLDPEPAWAAWLGSRGPGELSREDLDAAARLLRGMLPATNVVELPPRPPEDTVGA